MARVPLITSKEQVAAKDHAVFDSIVASRDMAHSQGVRTFVSQIIGALSPAALGIIVGSSNNFTAAFAVLAAAVLVSAGCMAVLIREGF